MKYFVLLIIGFSFSAQANLDGPSQEALDKTEELMLSAEKRQEAQKNDPKAQSADKSIDALTNDPQKKQQIYEMAAKVMKDLANKSNGDGKEMEKVMEEAQKNPEGFYNSMFSDAQKSEVRGLANEIEKSKAPIGTGQK